MMQNLVGRTKNDEVFSYRWCVQNPREMTGVRTTVKVIKAEQVDR